MAMASKSRLVVPRDISVGDIEQILEGWLAKRGSRDLSGLLADLLRSVTWKSAPRSSVLADYADLFQPLAALSPTGMLPNKRCYMALIAMHKAKPCNFTAKVADVWADELTGALRATMSKYRDICRDAAAKRKCMSKDIRNHRRQNLAQPSNIALPVWAWAGFSFSHSRNIARLMFTFLSRSPNTASVRNHILSAR